MRPSWMASMGVRGAAPASFEAGQHAMRPGLIDPIRQRVRWCGFPPSRTVLEGVGFVHRPAGLPGCAGSRATWISAAALASTCRMRAGIVLPSPAALAARRRRSPAIRILGFSSSLLAFPAQLPPGAHQDGLQLPRTSWMLSVGSFSFCASKWRRKFRLLLLCENLLSSSTSNLRHRSLPSHVATWVLERHRRVGGVALRHPNTSLRSAPGAPSRSGGAPCRGPVLGPAADRGPRRFNPLTVAPSPQDSSLDGADADLRRQEDDMASAPAQLQKGQPARLPRFAASSKGLVN